jgi:hypothetical protein
VSAAGRISRGPVSAAGRNSRARASVLTGVLAIVLCLAVAPRVTRAATAADAASRAGARRDATVARAISFIANAKLRVTKSQGTTVEAEGPVSGTIDGYLRLHVNVASASRMTSSFVGSSRAGTVQGTSVSDYGVSGNTLYYTGSANITHGSGAYAHVHAVGVHDEGTVNRSGKVGEMHINGRASL